MKVLTIGTPLNGHHVVLESGWVLVECQFCNEPMACREGNESNKPGDTLVLCCLNCTAQLEAMYELIKSSMN